MTSTLVYCPRASLFPHYFQKKNDISFNGIFHKLDVIILLWRNNYRLRRKNTLGNVIHYTKRLDGHGLKAFGDRIIGLFDQT